MVGTPDVRKRTRSYYLLNKLFACFLLNNVKIGKNAFTNNEILEMIAHKFLPSLSLTIFSCMIFSALKVKLMVRRTMNELIQQNIIPRKYLIR